MAKGFSTQGVCLLTDGQTMLDDVASALRSHDFEIVRQLPPGENWCFGGPGVVVPFLPEVNGYAVVDVVSHPWPDLMGDPKTDAMTFGAWSMGFFGPLAFPGSLARAQQHAWAWEPGRTVPERHGGFIRIRTSYVLGGDDKSPIMPADYDPLAEMNFISRIVLVLFGVSGVTCYFNPSGEVLYDDASFRRIWDACRQQENIPLPLWIDIRLFNLDAQFGFLDTVGNGQLDISDVEAIFPRGEHEPGDIAYYLRNVTHYLLDHKGEIRTGEAIDGPGESNLSWTIEVLDEGAITPPRRVVRLCPKASQEAIPRALAAISRGSA